MVQWIEFYNNQGFHGVHLYLTPVDYFKNRKELRLAGQRKNFML